MEKRMRRGRTKSKRSVLVTIAIFVVGGMLLFTLLGLVSDIRAAKEQYSLAQAQLDRINASNEELRVLLSGDDYVERIARDKYGFILPGEEVFIDVSGN
ncbi:MAG: septum formation initiator family protein [Clostridia bacterium]|nr:septum formation initiator family protein [Clostridia bacterium]